MNQKRSKKRPSTNLHQSFSIFRLFVSLRNILVPSNKGLSSNSSLCSYLSRFLSVPFSSAWLGPSILNCLFDFCFISLIIYLTFALFFVASNCDFVRSFFSRFTTTPTRLSFLASYWCACSPASSPRSPNLAILFILGGVSVNVSSRSSAFVIPFL